jgi:hypothetical protein
VKLRAHLHPVLRARKCGSVHPLHIYSAQLIKHRDNLPYLSPSPSTYISLQSNVNCWYKHFMCTEKIINLENVTHIYRVSQTQLLD